MYVVNHMIYTDAGLDFCKYFRFVFSSSHENTISISKCLSRK